MEKKTKFIPEKYRLSIRPIVEALLKFAQFIDNSAVNGQDKSKKQFLARAAEMKSKQPPRTT
jgi:hypothetical protein